MANARARVRPRSPTRCKHRRENPLYLAAVEWRWPKSQAARQVEKSLGRASPAVSAIAAPPNSPARESEQSLRPHGRARIVKAGRGSASAEVIAVQQQVFVGIDVSKRQLEVALNTGEGFGAELVRRLRTAAPEVVVLEASDYVGYVLDRRHVRIGLKNLELAFACRSEKERRQILRASYVNLGRDAAEYIRLGGRRGRCRWGRRRYFRSSYLGRTNHSLSCP
jgi:Bacterial lipid A biosynthesis acyltransferase